LIVYADILVLVNLIVNYFLLLATDKIIGFSPKTIRVLISAFLGAVSSLYIFLPKTTVLGELIFKIAVCFIMSWVAFGLKSAKRCFKAMSVLFVLTCAYAGGMTALWHIFKPNGMVIHNSVVYFNISPLVLVGFTVVSYIVFNILYKVFSRPAKFSSKCSVVVMSENKSIKLNAIVDTGNSITDVFGKSDIIIAEKGIVKKLFNENEMDKTEIKKRFRLVPCNTVSGERLLEGYRCDSALIENGGKKIEVKKPILAAAVTPLNEDYNAILNPQILKSDW